MCCLFASQPLETYETHTRSVCLGGQESSIRLEAAYWSILEELAAKEGMSVHRFVMHLYDEAVELHGDVRNFTSLLRCGCLKHISEQRLAALEREEAPFGLIAID